MMPTAVVECPRCRTTTTTPVDGYQGVIENHNDRRHQGWHVARLARVDLPEVAA